MKTKRKYFIKSLLRGFTFFIFAVSILMVAVILGVGGKKQRERTAETNQMALTVILNKVDEAIGRAEQNLYDLVYREELLENLKGADSELDAYEAQKQIMGALKEIADDTEIVNGVWYYLPSKDDFVLYTSGVLNVDEGQALLAELGEKIHTYQVGNPVESSKWILQTQGGNGYLMRLIDLRETYCGAWIRLDGLAKEFLPGDDAGLMFCSPTGDVVSGSRSFPEYTFAEDGYNTLVDDAGQKYLQVSLESGMGEYWLSYLTPEDTLLFSGMDGDVAWISAAAVLVILLFLASVSVLRGILYRPLENLNYAMEKIRKEGNLETQVKSTRLEEFEVLNQTFRDMLREVKDLKIDIYEQQLAQQRIKRQYLQIQLKTHFYLNCLNIIYSLAQMKDYRLIQELTRCLGAYYRYTSDDSQELHVLERELEHVRNYMHIQEIRFPEQFTYLEEVDETLLREKVPSLLLQTFVENALEHAIDLDKKNWVRLRIFPLEREGLPGMQIEVRDNGKGFEEKKLELLNADGKEEVILETKDEIGISNVKNRLELIYQGKADIRFFNAPEGGAVVSIWLPIIEEEEESD